MVATCKVSGLVFTFYNSLCNFLFVCCCPAHVSLERLSSQETEIVTLVIVIVTDVHCDNLLQV